MNPRASSGKVEQTLRPRSRWFRTWILVVAAVLCAGLGGWGAAQLLSPDPVSAEADDFTLVTVANGEVGQSLGLNATARWRSTQSGVNRASGIVTHVNHGPGDMAGQGAVLYRVNERPVVLAQGAVPAFRDLERGVDGEDVRQLQAMLLARGWLSATPDGDFGALTERAVVAWQKDLGLVGDGRVVLGDVMFVPDELPARLALDSSVVHRDAGLAGGEKVLTALPPEPAFTMTVTSMQAAMIPDDTPVTVASPQGNTWQASVAGRAAQEGGDGVVLRLDGADGGAITGDQASEVPIEGETVLAANVEVVPTVEGLVVPSAALKVRGDGSTAVIGEDGVAYPVDIVASASGQAVITGVGEGGRVRVPASSDGAGA